MRANRLGSPLLTLFAGVAVLVMCMGASVTVGLRDMHPAAALAALFSLDDSPGHLVVRTARLPRALIAATVGASLAVAGAVMQVLTRNPLASPGLLGINSGAAFLVVVAVHLLEVPSLSAMVGFALGGAALAAGAVYLLASAGREGLTPIRMTLAGAAVTSFLLALTQGILVANEQTLDAVRFWLMGSVAGRDGQLLAQVAPYMTAGLAIAFTLGRDLNLISLGDDIARGLGQRTLWVRLAGALAVVLLAGSSVAVAGPIGFIGLFVPHLTRFLVGTDHRWVLPHTAIHGAVLLLVADIAARFVIPPQEVPVGVMTALAGVPFFLYLARRVVSPA